MKITTKNWLNYAEIDLHTCKKLLDDDFLTNSLAFHAQQTVEKCFKAVFEENNLKILKIHNLIRLHEKINKILNFNIDVNLLRKTDSVYIETRYPLDIGILPDGKPSIAEAKELYNFANYIFQNTKKMLEKQEKK